MSVSEKNDQYMDKKTTVSNTSRKIMQSLAIILLIAAFISALWVNFGIRAPLEAQNKTVGLLVDYDELKLIVDNSGLDFPDMLRKASDAGVTGLVVRERTLSDWEMAGDVFVYTGSQLVFQLENIYGESAAEKIKDMRIISDNTYILTKNTDVYEQIYSLLEAKKRQPVPFEYLGYLGISTNLSTEDRENLGLGFPFVQLQQAADVGLGIIVRIRSWEPVDKDNLEEVLLLVSKIDNLAGIGFYDKSLPGNLSDPILLDLYEVALKTLKRPLITFEFFDQIDLPLLAGRLDNNVVRAHAIAENELYKYTNINDIVVRYSLAVRERNIRYIYIRFLGLDNPVSAWAKNEELIKDVKKSLMEDGFKVGEPKSIPAFSLPLVPLFLLGVGVIIAGCWILVLIIKPLFSKRKWLIPFLVLIVLGIVVWTFGLTQLPIITRKLFALAGSIFFPSLGAVLLVKREYPAVGRIKCLLRAIIQLLAMSAFTLMGAMIMSALLSEPVFMLKLDSFFGVKAAHLIPLAIVPFVLWQSEKDWFKLLLKAVKSKVKLWQIGIGLIFLVAVTLYILRTGNNSPIAILNVELKVRQFLNSWLGVRPRTTEFLIGHPSMLVMLYFGYKLKRMPVLILGLMGQVSLINTYAHLHTPLMISLQRSGHGLWSGVLIGVIIIVILELILAKAQRVSERLI